ncbi:M20 family metallopeptidase [Gorillibacterium massiliense]|uniref:M20 family metallopeptidase n=1 Tax=Gorillibacterium massiliense TaxID=1280390 RepID=UPI0004AF42DC|nr:M20 family metallopeptidase [Gorillibacterium massiliense]
MKNKIIEAIEAHSGVITETAKFIGSHPELGNEEFLASSRLIDEFTKFGFHIEKEPLRIPTAFIASYASSKPGPVIAFLCEYDALPELGHACGHHLIAAMGLAAAVGLKAVIDEIGGTIRVYGTPAEETEGAKVLMADAGMFDDVDAAMMAHPYHSHVKSGTSLAMDALQFDFHGKAAHAAASPHEGINALDGIIQLFNAVSALRQQLPSHVRIHGIVANGGKAPNIIPDYASAQFYVRSANRPFTNETVQKVLRCAEGAALQTGCRMESFHYQLSYDELITNSALSELFTQSLEYLGVSSGAIQEPRKDSGSLDLGNVSRRCPAVHPYVKVADGDYSLHTPEFRDAAMLPKAFDGMLLGAKALALSAYEVMTRPDLMQRIKDEFAWSLQNPQE